MGNDVFVRNLPSIPLFEPRQQNQRLGVVDIFHPEPKDSRTAAQRKQSEALKTRVLREVEILKTLDHVRFEEDDVLFVANHVKPNIICLVQVYQAEETL